MHFQTPRPTPCLLQPSVDGADPGDDGYYDDRYVGDAPATRDTAYRE